MLSVLLARDVEEEAERVVAPVAAQVALEGVGAGGVVAHVDGVHRLALERYPAKLNSINSLALYLNLFFIKKCFP